MNNMNVLMCRSSGDSYRRSSPDRSLSFLTDWILISVMWASQLQDVRYG